jgi:hypothetical protein
MNIKFQCSVALHSLSPNFDLDLQQWTQPCLPFPQAAASFCPKGVEAPARSKKFKLWCFKQIIHFTTSINLSNFTQIPPAIRFVQSGNAGKAGKVCGLVCVIGKLHRFYCV